MLRVTVVSNFSTFLAVGVIIWVETFHVQFLLFLHYPMLCQAFRGRLLMYMLLYVPLPCSVLQSFLVCSAADSGLVNSPDECCCSIICSLAC